MNPWTILIDSIRKKQSTGKTRQPDLGPLQWLSVTWWCLSWPWPFNFATHFCSFWAVLDPIRAQWGLAGSTKAMHIRFACIESLSSTSCPKTAKARKNKYEQTSFSHPEVYFGISGCGYSAQQLPSSRRPCLVEAIWCPLHSLGFHCFLWSNRLDIFRIPKLEDDGGSRVGASKLFCIWLLGFLSVAAQTLQQQKHPIHSEVQKKFGFPTELLVDVVCVTCSAHAFVVATHATHHLPLLLKFLKNIEGKPQTNTEKRGKAQATRPKSQSSRG